MTHDQRRAEAARIRDDAEVELEHIRNKKYSFMSAVMHMGSLLLLSDSDMQRFSDHIEDLESDLFADEIRDLKTQIETASDLANQSNWDRSREYWDGK